MLRRYLPMLAAVTGTAMALAGCAREDPLARADLAQLRARVGDLEARLRVLELARQASLERPVTLTQTWITPGQAPATSQATYHSPEACEAARKRALADADRLIAGREAQAQAEAAAQGVKIVVDAERPVLQASCSN
jgi:hypothetical protein